MFIINYKNFYKRYDREILFYSHKISPYDFDDIAQYIRMYIWKYLWKFDVRKSTLKYYVHMMVVTGYRKAIYEKTKQYQFEEGFYSLIEDIPSAQEPDRYDKLLEDILDNLKNKKEIVVFYAIVYNHNKKYTEISKILNMSYPVFLNYIKQIRLTITKLLSNP